MARSFLLPPNRQFGECNVEFLQGEKRDDDYIIRVNGKQVTDGHIFECLHKYSSNKESAKNLLELIWELGQEKDIRKEKDVYEKIQGLPYCDELKTYLFAIWHRLIIDDINYPIDKGLNGRKRLLGQIYLLISKKFGFNLPSYIVSLPEEIFKLGFPQGIGKYTISTQQWNEIYDLYAEFSKRIKC